MARYRWKRGSEGSSNVFLKSGTAASDSEDFEALSRRSEDAGGAGSTDVYNLARRKPLYQRVRAQRTCLRSLFIGGCVGLATLVRAIPFDFSNSDLTSLSDAGIGVVQILLEDGDRVLG
jgi:hypothetical protein